MEVFAVLALTVGLLLPCTRFHINLANDNNKKFVVVFCNEKGQKTQREFDSKFQFKAYCAKNGIAPYGSKSKED